MRETFFWRFFQFFHVWKPLFTYTFFRNFTHNLAFSRRLFLKFSRISCKFSRTQKWFFSRKGFYFHVQNFGWIIKKHFLYKKTRNSAPPPIHPAPPTPFPDTILCLVMVKGRPIIHEYNCIDLLNSILQNFHLFMQTKFSIFTIMKKRINGSKRNAA